MFARASVKAPKNQQGLVLLVLIIIIALALISYSLSNLSIAQVRMGQGKKTQMALKKAKGALVAHAITNSYRAADVGRVGNLPCPDGIMQVLKVIRIQIVGTLIRMQLVISRGSVWELIC